MLNSVSAKGKINSCKYKECGRMMGVQDAYYISGRGPFLAQNFT